MKGKGKAGRETCDSVPNSTAPFTSASADDEMVAVARVEVGGKEGT